MKLHRLSVRNLKGVRERDLEFPERGVVVIEGPNEIGKTSMIEALDLLLEEKDSSRKRHVLAARPVGQDVPTSIEAEISSGPYRFVYRKQWFRQPGTELHVTAPRVEHLTGVEAHDRVAAILAETTDVALWRALRLLQATPLQQVELGGSTALSAALDAAASSIAAQSGLACAVGDRDEEAERREAQADVLVAAAQAEYERYFTPGRAQPTGEYRQAREAVESAQEAEAAAKQAVDEVAADVERHARVAADQAHAAETVQLARADLAEHEQAWQGLSALLEAAASADREAATARREAERARERHDDRVRQVDELAGREAQVREHAEEVAQLLEELTPREDRLSRLLGARDAADAAACRADEDLAGAERTAERARRTAEADGLRDRLARAEAADAERRRAHGALSGLTLDEAGLRGIEAAQTALDLAVAQASGDSAQVHLAPASPDAVVLIDGRQPDWTNPASQHLSLTQGCDIEIPGVVTLRLRPESGAAERMARVDAKRRELAAALAEAGVADVDQARDLVEARRRAADDLARAADRLDDVLAGHTLIGLRDQLATLDAAAEGGPSAARRSDAPQERPDATEPSGEARADAPREPGDLGDGVSGAVAGEVDVEGLRRQSAQARVAAAEAAARVESARTDLEAMRVSYSRADSLLGAAQREVDASADRLAAARRDDPDDDLREQARVADELARRAASDAAALRQRLARDDADGVRHALEAAHAAVSAGTERVNALREQRVAIEARLEHSGRQGRYDAWDKATSQRQHAERRLDAVTRRAEAARLLYDTLQTHRAEAKRRYVEPFALALRRLGSLVLGPGFDVEVDESLVITARILDGTRIDFDALSTGAKEQLAILTRLAVATLVDRDGGVPVVIDDALGYSDPHRLKRMARAFSDVADRAQVILLTCTPGRYDGIVGAHVTRLTDATAA